MYSITSKLHLNVDFEYHINRTLGVGPAAVKNISERCITDEGQVGLSPIPPPTAPSPPPPQKKRQEKKTPPPPKKKKTKKKKKKKTKRPSLGRPRRKTAGKSADFFSHPNELSEDTYKQGAFLLQNSQWIIHSCLAVDTVFLLAFLILSLTFMSLFVINRPVYDISGQRTKRLLGSTEVCNHSFSGGLPTTTTTTTKTKTKKTLYDQ